MIRSWRDWLSEDPARWQASLQRYQSYIDARKLKFSRSLLEFVDRFSLHDGKIVRIDELTAIPTKRDCLLTIVSPKNGWLRDTDAILAIMHLRGLRTRAVGPVPDADIMFFDTEVDDDGTQRVSFALADGTQRAFRFADFGYYVHDYRD